MGTTRERSLRVSATGIQRTMRSSTLTTPRRSILCVPAATTPHIRRCGSSLGHGRSRLTTSTGLALAQAGSGTPSSTTPMPSVSRSRIDDRVVAELVAVAQRHDLIDVQPREPVAGLAAAAR